MLDSVGAHGPTKGGVMGLESRGVDISRRIAGLLLALVMSAQAGAATYYLDAAAGDDRNPGTTDRPWKSLSKAQAIAGPGDTILLRNGQYGGFTGARLKCPLHPAGYTEPLPARQKWITYKAVAGHDNVRFEKIELRFADGPRRLAHVFEDLTVQPAAGRTLDTSRVVGLRFRNVRFVGTTDPGLLESGTVWYNNVDFRDRNGDIVLENCDVSGGYGGVTVSGLGYHITITGCDIHDVGVDKIYCGGGADFRIENNRLHGRPLLPDQHPDCIQFYTAADRYGPEARAVNVIIRGNMMYDHSSQGIWTGGSYLENVVFENNLMYKLGNYEWRVYNVHGGLIRNNTIVGGGGRNTGINVYGAPSCSDITVVNNIFACPYWGSTAVMTYHDHNLYYKSGAGPGDAESHSRSYPSIEAAVAELFADAAADDYLLAEGSVAIDFGDPQWDPGTDLTGDRRRGAPDAGCYEYGAAVTPYSYASDVPTDNTTPDVSDDITVILPPNVSPTVAVVDPANEAAVGGIVTIQVRAVDEEDPDGTLQVEVSMSATGGDGATWCSAAYNQVTGYYELKQDTTELADASRWIIEARASDSAASTTYAEPIVVVVQNAEPVAATMHVAAIEVLRIGFDGNTAGAWAQVRIVNKAGEPVSGARVVGAFSNDIAERLMGYTDDTGAAGFTTVYQIGDRFQVTFSVEEVLHPDYIYAPGENVESSGS